MTTVEREVTERPTSPQRDTIAFEEVSVDTTAADDTDFEPTIVRGRE